MNSAIINFYSQNKLAAASFDTDAQVFITATGITDTTQKNAINDLVLNLKSNSLWSKMSAIYPFIGSTTTTQKFNLKDPRDLDAAYRLTFNYSAGGTHSSSGWKAPWANTHFIFDQANPNVSIYINQAGSNDGQDLYDGGAIDGTDSFEFITNFQGNNTMYWKTNSSQSYLTYNHGGTLGFYGFNDNGTNTQIFLNSSQVGTASTTTHTSNTIKTYIGGININNAINQDSNKRWAWCHFGYNMTGSDFSNLYTIVQAYQTALGRNV